MRYVIGAIAEADPEPSSVVIAIQARHGQAKEREAFEITNRIGPLDRPHNLKVTGSGRSRNPKSRSGHRRR